MLCPAFSTCSGPSGTPFHSFTHCHPRPFLISERESEDSHLAKIMQIPEQECLLASQQHISRPHTSQVMVATMKTSLCRSPLKPSFLIRPCILH